MLQMKLERCRYKPTMVYFVQTDVMIFVKTGILEIVKKYSRLVKPCIVNHRVAF